MKNRTFKKSLAMFLSFLMVLTSLVFVVPEIVPEADALGAGQYSVRIKFQVKTSSPSGHMYVYYFPFNANGSVDTSSTDLKKLVINSYAGDGYGSTGIYEPSFDITEGFPWKVEIRVQSGTVRFLGFYINNTEVTGLVANNNDGYNINGAITKSWAYNDNTNLSSDAVAHKCWDLPAVSSLDGLEDTMTFNLTESTNYDTQKYTRTVKAYDQYGVVLPVKNFEWSLETQTGNGSTGVTITKNSDGSGESNATIKIDETVQQNLPSNSSDGKLVYRYYAKYGSVYDSSTVTVNCPKYNATYVNAAGQTVKTTAAGYYNSTFTSHSDDAANTASTYNDTHHTTYSWPQQDYLVTGPVTISEKQTSRTHTLTAWSATDDDNHGRSCSGCAYTTAEGHSYSDWAVADIANHQKSCTVCGHVVTETHTFGNWVSGGNDKNASHTKKCDYCTQTVSEKHTWDEGRVTKAAQCATDGLRLFTCTADGCGATYTEVIPATNGHVFGGTYTNVDKDGDGKNESHRQFCQNGDPNCTAYLDTAHTYGAWEYDDETNHVHKCTVCQLPTAIEKHTHSWDEGVVTLKPDCENDGERTLTCNECSGTKIVAEPKLGHDWGNYVANDDGVTHKRTCNNCKIVEKNTSCEFKNYSTTKSADCDDNEVRVYTCSFCSNIRTVEGGTDKGNELGLAKAKGHHWLDCTLDGTTGDLAYLARAATCTKSAIYYNYCGDCGAKSDVANYNQTAVILGLETITQDRAGVNMVYYSGEPKLGHKFEGAVVANETDKTHTYKCIRFDECGATGANGVEGQTVSCLTTCKKTVVDPDCVNGGYTNYDCTVCTNEWATDFTPAADHKFENNTVADKYLVSPADCVNPAKYYVSCSVCNAAATAENNNGTAKTFDNGNANGHVYGAWANDGVDVDGNGTHTKVCSVCAEADGFANRVVTEAHVWTFDKTISAPTWGVDGEDQYKCTACPATKIVKTTTDADNNPPSVSIDWKGTVWNTVLNTITFGKYVNYDVQLAITSSDAESGVLKTEYIVSSEAIADIEAETNWTAFNTANPLVVSKADAEKYVVYAKVTDVAGNVAYASTDGFVVDKTAPVINLDGVSNDEGTEYCGDVVVTVDEDNLDTLKATNSLGEFTIAAPYTATSLDGVWTITATDKAGNKDTVTFTRNSDHTWSETVLAENKNLATPADCTNAATYYKVCAVCGEISKTETFKDGESLGHAELPAVEEEREEATCEKAGKYNAVVYCDVCGEVVSETEVEIPALEHTLNKTDAVAPGCGTEGNIAYWTCTTVGGCQKIYSDAEATAEATDVVIPALEHTLVKTDAVNPDCDTDGNIAYWTCTTEGGCKKIYSDAEATTEATDIIIPQLGHKEGTPVEENRINATCTEGGSYETVVYCSVCNEQLSRVKTEVSALGHEELPAVEENREEATCGKAGKYDSVVYCGVCDEVVSRETKEIPALQHTLVKTDAVEPDCDTDGNIAYWTCTTEGGCKKIYSDADAETEVTDVIRPALGHDTEFVPAVEADCTKAGTIAHYKCNNGCGLYFEDAEATKSLDSIEGDPIKDHTFTGAWEFNRTTNKHQRQCSVCTAWTELTDCTFAADCKPADNSDVAHTHEKICECGNSKIEICTPVKGETHKDPICGDDEATFGWTDYNCAECSNTWQGDKVYQAHNFVVKDQFDGDCVTKGYIVYECTNDGCDGEKTQALSFGTAHVGNAETGVNTTTKNKKAATCKTGGYTGDIACLCGVILKKGETTGIDENNHFWGDVAVGTGTCTVPGYQISYCEDCGKENVVTGALNPDNHTNISEDKDVPPTCTEYGYEGATVCLDCNKVIKEGKPVDPLGHNISPWFIITMPSEDGSTPGYAERWCLRCGGQREPRSDFYYDEIYYVVYHNDNGVRLTAPRYYIEGDYTLKPEETPTKKEDDRYRYEFSGWDHTEDELNNVKKQMPVVAQYKAIEKSYKVTFYDANGNAIPVSGIQGKDILFSQITKAYSGATPTKKADANYTYEFVGWNIKCDYETGEASVTPEFRATPVVKKDDGGLFGWFFKWLRSILAKLGIHI